MEAAAGLNAAFRAELLLASPDAGRLRDLVKRGAVVPRLLRARLWRLLLLGTTEPFPRLDAAGREAW